MGHCRKAIAPVLTKDVLYQRRAADRESTYRRLEQGKHNLWSGFKSPRRYQIECDENSGLEKTA